MSFKFTITFGIAMLKNCIAMFTIDIVMLKNCIAMFTIRIIIFKICVVMFTIRMNIFTVCMVLDKLNPLVKFSLQNRVWMKNMNGGSGGIYK